jgi:3-oxoacyl-[acyl-carrier protein] reductase
VAKESTRVAFVTGAAGGIGGAISTRLAHDGYRVILCDVTSEIVALARTMSDAGFAAEAKVGDVSDEAWVVGTVRGLCDDSAGIDVLVNNAGISPKHDGRKHLVVDMPLSEWERVLMVNLGGAFLLCRECVPAMQRKGWGRIINMSSQAGRLRADMAGSHYAASKAGLIGFSRVLAGEVAGTGITVNCVAPGRIDTRMGTVGGAAATAAYVDATPARRMGKPDDVAEVVAFLASDGAEFLTGTTVDVNGGFSMI